MVQLVQTTHVVGNLWASTCGCKKHLGLVSRTTTQNQQNNTRGRSAVLAYTVDLRSLLVK